MATVTQTGAQGAQWDLNLYDNEPMPWEQPQDGSLSSDNQAPNSALANGSFGSAYEMGYSASSAAPDDEVLGSGEVLAAGQSMWTADRRYRLSMQGDGNLVIYRASDDAAMWNSGTWGHAGAHAVMQSDGNFVIYDVQNRAVWASSTFTAGSSLTLQADGSLTASSATIFTAEDAALVAGEFMLAGQSIWTADRRYRLNMQEDGNLVIYRAADNAAMWNTGTSGHAGARAVMQVDGNFVVYSAQNEALWMSGAQAPGSVLRLQADGGLTLGGSAPVTIYAPNDAVLASGEFMLAGQSITTASGRYRLSMQDDGNLVIYRTSDDAAMWNSGTAGHAGARAVMQRDGNFVVYSVQNEALWTSSQLDNLGGLGTLGMQLAETMLRSGSALHLRDDGSLTLNNANTASTVYTPGDAVLTTGEFMRPGQSITTANGRYRLSLQSDGNLVLYRAADNMALWDAGTAGHPGAWVAMQADGNLAVYSAQNEALWTSGTQAPGGTLTVQANGNLTVEGRGVSATLYAPDTLAPGDVLQPEQAMWTADRRYRLVMQSDGNLVLYRAADNVALWHSGTGGHAGARAVMQTDGTLVVRSLQDQALWTSGTLGAGAALRLQADGSLLVNGSRIAATVYAPSDAMLTPGETLLAGQSITTANGLYRLSMQDDGNLVLYRAADNMAIWSSGTGGHPGARAIMQHDGNLMVYGAQNEALYTSGPLGVGAALRVQADGSLTVDAPVGAVLTSGESMSPGQSITTANGRYRLSMQEDGNLVVYSASNVALWNSQTSGHPGARAVMQTDGNLVIYDAQNQALWASNTHEAGAVLNLQADGGLAVSGAGSSADLYRPPARRLQPLGAPRMRSSLEWERIRAMWGASQGEPYRVYQQMIENGWDLADVGFATGQSVQAVGVYLTRAGAQAGFGGPATLGRDAVDAPFLAAVNAEVARYGHLTAAGTPGWLVVAGTDEGGLYGPSFLLDLRAFTKWYMTQPQGQDFARVHGGVVEEGSTEQSVLLQSGARMEVGLDDDRRYMPAEMLWNLDMRFVQNPGNVVIRNTSHGTISGAPGGSPLILSGSVDPITQVSLWMLVDKPENRELVQAFGLAGATLPNNTLAERMRTLYGSELATALYRLSRANAEMRKQYLETLDRDFHHSPLEADGTTLRVGWQAVPGGVDESGQAVFSHQFDAAAHYRWYVSQADPRQRLMGTIYGKETTPLGDGQSGFATKGGQDALPIMLESSIPDKDTGQYWVTVKTDLGLDNETSGLDLDRPDQLRDPQVVQYVPLVGFVTPSANVIPEKPDAFERLLTAGVVIIFSMVAGRIGTQLAAGLMTSAAVAGAVGTAVSGAINGNLHFKDVLKGALAAALTAGIMQKLTGWGAGAGAGARAIAARTGIQGLIQAALGGSFRDGALSGFAEGLGAELSEAIKGGIPNNLDRATTSALKYYADMIGAATRIVFSGADAPGYGLASAFLDRTLTELGIPRAPEPVMDPDALLVGGGVGGLVGNAPQPAPAPPPDWAGGGVIGGIGNMPMPAPTPAPAPVAVAPAPTPTSPAPVAALPVDQVGAIDPPAPAPQEPVPGAVRVNSLSQNGFVDELNKFGYTPLAQEPVDGMTQAQANLRDITGQIYSAQDAERLMNLRGSDGQPVVSTVARGITGSPRQELGTALTYAAQADARDQLSRTGISPSNIPANQFVGPLTPQQSALLQATGAVYDAAQAVQAVNWVNTQVTQAGTQTLPNALLGQLLKPMVGTGVISLGALTPLGQALLIGGLVVSPGNLGPGDAVVFIRHGLRLVVPVGALEGQLQELQPDGRWAILRNGVNQHDPGLDRLRSNPDLSVLNVQLLPSRGTDRPTFVGSLSDGRQWVQTGANAGDLQERNAQGQWVTTHRGVTLDDVLLGRTEMLPEGKRQELSLPPKPIPVEMPPPVLINPRPDPADQPSPVMPGQNIDQPIVNPPTSYPADPPKIEDLIITSDNLDELRRIAKEKGFAGKNGADLKRLYGWGNDEDGVNSARSNLDDSVIQRIQKEAAREEVEALRDMYRAAAQSGRGGNVAPLRAAYMEDILRLWK